MWKMQQGSARSKDDKPKDAKILPFQAGSDYSLSATPPLVYHERTCSVNFEFSNSYVDFLKSGKSKLQIL